MWSFLLPEQLSRQNTHLIPAAEKKRKKKSQNIPRALAWLTKLQFHEARRVCEPFHRWAETTITAPERSGTDASQKDWSQKGKVKHFIYSNIDKFSGNLLLGKRFPRQGAFRMTAQLSQPSIPQSTFDWNRIKVTKQNWQNMEINTAEKSSVHFFSFLFFVKFTKKLLKCNFSIFLSKSIKCLRDPPEEEEEEPRWRWRLFYSSSCCDEGKKNQKNLCLFALLSVSACFKWS